MQSWKEIQQKVFTCKQNVLIIHIFCWFCFMVKKHKMRTIQKYVCMYVWFLIYIIGITIKHHWRYTSWNKLGLRLRGVYKRNWYCTSIIGESLGAQYKSYEAEDQLKSISKFIKIGQMIRDMDGGIYMIAL